MSELRFFESAREWSDWLTQNGDSATELVLGFNKTGAARGGLTYAEALDVALAFGWIDAVRRGVDAARYSIRFTPRKRGSIWSAVNLAKVESLLERGLMRPPGLAAYQARDHAASVQRSADRKTASLSAELEARFRRQAKGWAFFEAQPPGYRKNACWWVMSARQDQTRTRRLETLIAESVAGRRLSMLSPGKK